MSSFFEHTVGESFNFWIYVILLMIGLWAVIAKNNLIKKLLGLAIFQTAIILFFVSLGAKEGSTIPILDHHGHGEHHAEAVPGEEGHGEDGHGEHGEKAPPQGEGDREHEEDGHGEHASAHAIAPDGYSNPLPHVLMLTAIVVGVSTVGVALSIAQRLFKEFGTLEEDEILEQIKSGQRDV